METTEDLAKRAVRAKCWRWLPGMRALDSCNEEHPARVIDARRSVVYEDNDGAIHEGVVSRSDLPDLTDPATVGCLLALVREARGDHAWLPTLIPIVSGARWAVEHTLPHAETWYESEAAALVAALEAAP